MRRLLDRALGLVPRSLLGGWRQASATQAPLVAAGVAFYAFLSLFPAMVAASMTYGLVADPMTVSRQSQRIAQVLPDEAAALVTDQLDALAGSAGGSLGLGLVVALAAALFGASRGVGNLVLAVNRTFGYEERGFVRRRAMSVGMTAGAVVFVLVTLVLVAVVPVVIDALVELPGQRLLLGAARWLLLLAAIVLAVGILFRVAPNRPEGEEVPLVGRGVLVATGMWVGASVGFSVYVDTLGTYGATYGALAGVVVLMLWLWAGIFALLLGAAVEAVREDAPVVAEAAEAAEG